MTRSEEETPTAPTASVDVLRLAATMYLARCKGSSPAHSESDLRIYLGWCNEHGLQPLAARRVGVELYVRWSQEIRRFCPSTVSRRLSGVCPVNVNG